MSVFRNSSILLVMVLLLSAPADARIWTDITGKHSIEAKLVDVKEGTVRLQRPNGTIVSLPVAKLSADDQEYLKKKPDEEESSESEGIKVGDKVYVNSRGQWKPAVVKEVMKTSVGLRYMVLVDGSDTTTRVTEKRIRAMGGNAKAGSALPGDKVEVRRGFDWKPATLVSIDGTWATIRMEGSLGTTRAPLSSLRTPGSGSDDEESEEDFFDRAARMGPDEIRRMMSGDTLDSGPGGGGSQFPRPEPAEMRGVSLASATSLSTAQGAPNTFDFSASDTVQAKLGRKVPVALMPSRDVFDGAEQFSVSASGKYVAVLRKSFGDKAQLIEIVDMTSDKPAMVSGLPNGTCFVAISPEGTRVLTGRTPKMSFSLIFDLWKVSDGKLEAEDCWEFTSGSDRGMPSRFSRLSQAQWVSEEQILIDSRSSLLLWDVPTGSPKWKIGISGNRLYCGPNNQYVVTNSGKTGVMVVDTQSGSLKAIIGPGQCINGSVSISPSGKALAIGNSQIFQLWNLESGEKIVCAANPAGNKSPATWTGSEHLLAFGNQAVDLRTMKLATGGVNVAGTAVAGYRWNVEEASRDRRLYVTAAAIDKSSSTQPVQVPKNLPTLLGPGDAVALDVRVDPSIAADVYSKLELAITDAGFRVDSSSNVRLVATTQLGEQKSQEYTTFFGRDRPVTVSWQTHIYSWSLQAGGKAYLTLKSTRDFSPPSSIRIPEGQSAQQYVNERHTWSSSRMPQLVLPDYIYPMSN